MEVSVRFSLEYHDVASLSFTADCSMPKVWVFVIIVQDHDVRIILSSYVHNCSKDLTIISSNDFHEKKLSAKIVSLYHHVLQSCVYQYDIN